MTDNLRPIGDGMADDTAALQAALDIYSDKARTGCVMIPAGVYRTTSTLKYLGSYSYAVRIMGEASCAGPSGTVIRYDGPPGGAVLEISGGADCVVEHLAIDGGKKAFAGLYAHRDRRRLIGVTNLLIDRLTVGGVTGPLTSCISLGVDHLGEGDTEQCDDVIIRNCKLVGGEVGLRTSSANVKNFYVDTTTFAYATKYGVGFGGSGTLLLAGCIFAANGSSDVYATTGNVTIDTCSSEGSRRLLISAGVTMNPGNVRLLNNQWYGVGPEDDGDIIISHHGVLRLEDNQLANNRTDATLPRVRSIYGQRLPSAVDSSGNWYQRARPDYTDGRGLPLFVDGSMNDLFVTAAADGGRVRTFGDYSGVGTDLCWLENRPAVALPGPAGRGVATIPRRRSWVLVEHGLSYTPDPADVSLTAFGLLGRASYPVVYGTNNSHLQVGVDRDPGPDGAKVLWTVIPR